MELIEVAVGVVKTTRMLSNGKIRLRDPKELKSLKESIQLWGQLQPIIIERDYELVDGMRRLSAFRELGLPTIAAVFKDNLDEFTARSLELEANIQRLDMDWKERAFALAELATLHKRLHPEWSQDQVAAIAGLPQSRLSEALSIVGMMKLFPQIGEAKSMNQAQSWAKAKVANIVRAKDVKDAPETYASVEERIILGDARLVIKDMPDGVFKLILTDPPFGIDYDSRNADQVGGMTSYQDDEEYYLSLLAMAPDLFRVAAKDSFMIWFLGISWYERAKLAFREAGWIVDEIPDIWDRSEGKCFTSRPDRYFARGYDIALHCIKGDPQVVQRGKPNIIRAMPISSSERDLLVERPVELYQEFIRRLTVPGEVVVDFFAGSGSVLAAAASLERQFVGVEQDGERRAVAIKKVHSYTPSGK